jgi:uncharacterized protein (TIGR03435 family)
MNRALTGVFVMVLTGGGALAQSADPMAQFEVASVKPSAPPSGRGMRVGGTGGPGTKDPTRIQYENMSLSNLVYMAYDLKRYQYSGPSWMDTERFDVTAKIPEGATREQFRVMMQNLLAERFKLVVHREKKDMPGFQMVVARSGPKIKRHEEQPAPNETAPDSPPPGGGPPRFQMDKEGFPILPAVGPGGRGSPMTIMMNGRARSLLPDSTMEQFAGFMANQIGKPVTDATGIEGKYDFSLYWESDRGLDGGPPPPPPPGAGPGERSPDSESGPNIYTALQEQLGLKLDAKKVTVDLLVVDRCEKVPTEN